MAEGNTKITDTFWTRYRELVRSEMIPYQWKVLNDEIDVRIERERDDATSRIRKAMPWRISGSRQGNTAVTITDGSSRTAMSINGWKLPRILFPKRWMRI